MIPRDISFDLPWITKKAAGLPPVRMSFATGRYFLVMGLTGRCNFRCPICYYSDITNQRSSYDMPFTLLQRILNSLPKLRCLLFGMDGEPFLYKKIFSALDLASEHAETIAIVTNGSLLTYETCFRLADYAFGSISLSIDAADAENYTRFRPGGDFLIFKRNAKCLAQIFGSCVRLHATVCHENLQSLLGLPRLARELDIPHITLQQLRPHLGSYKRGVSRASQYELEVWLENMLEKALKYDIILEPDRFFGGSQMSASLRQLSVHAPDNFITPLLDLGECPHVENIACIMSDGKLFPCAGDFVPVSLQEYSFDSIFNHPYLLALRAMRRSGRYNVACARCMNDI